MRADTEQIPSPGRVRVLVVEDDPTVREAIVALLEDDGFEVEPVAHGQDALDVLVRSSPGVIVLDWAMPVMDGPAFRVAQLTDPRLRRIPVVAVSAYRGDALRSQGLLPATFVKKPFRADELLGAVRRLVSRPPP
jgi:CheY-like chemotaxis protein